MKCVSISVRGAIQGVGFRPFVYNLANRMHLNGYVKNTPSGVEIEVEGDDLSISRFIRMLETHRPPLAVIDSITYQEKPLRGFTRFEISESDEGSEVFTLVLPDIATCKECIDEVFTRGERRFNYPFTNCTNCGPRFTIIEKLPYDRRNTTMRGFRMCTLCRKEYLDPEDRRFHAQPIACPRCGPRVWLTDNKGMKLASDDESLSRTIQHIQNGMIVAVKGLGGFLLLCDARNETAVSTLRKRKYREEKPFAVMYPSLKMVKSDCEVSPAEAKTLLSPQSPIVLLRKRRRPSVAENVAPLNPYLGVMLPYTPLYHILLRRLNTPVVATSGNMTDDPIAIDNDEAITRLGGIADYFLMHNRPIIRRVDDSVVRVFHGRLMILRRARGYAPLPLPVKNPGKGSILALGGHLKNTIAFTKKDRVFISQHIGDLETREAILSFREVIDSLPGLYRFIPDLIAVDLHPRYTSTLIGEELQKKWNKDLFHVQHHHAHIASCMLENGIDTSVLGVAWDGVGYGTDGYAWGSEFLISDYTEFERVAHILSFPLPGGEKCVRVISRSGLGMLYTLLGDEILETKWRFLPVVQGYSEREITLLVNSMRSGLNSPMVYGMGRLFDGISSILGVRQSCSFEAQGAMELEFLAAETYQRVSGVPPYEYEITGEKPMVLDWRPMLSQILDDMKTGVKRGRISLRVHATLVRMIYEIAGRCRIRELVLSGGVFQNTLLLGLIMKDPQAKMFKIYTHSRIPPNDGCISAGQCAIALARKR